MDFNILDFGAVADGKTVNTKAIQAAIDKAAEQAGRVVVAGGVFKCGSIQLKSNVELHLAADATLLGSENYEDFPEWETTHVNSEMLPRWRNACLIFAEKAENIAITGLGKIDCNGHLYVQPRTKTQRAWKYERIDALTPPRVVFFTGCKNIRVKDITMTNQPAGWSYWIHDCDLVHMNGLNILAEVDYPNNDGIHINSSRDVTVSNCNIRCGDDCLVVRANNVSLQENKVCERVTVTNCNLTSYSGGIRVGWIKDGTIKNCVFSNLVMTDTSVGISVLVPNQHRTPKPEIPISGMSDEGREYTRIENLSFNNIIMDKTAGYPIYIHTEQDPRVTVDVVKNLYFSGIRANGPLFPKVCGQKEKYIENVQFNDCTFTVTDGSEFPEIRDHGACYGYDHNYYPMDLHYIRGLKLNNTEFNVEK